MVDAGDYCGNLGVGQNKEKNGNSHHDSDPGLIGPGMQNVTEIMRLASCHGNRFQADFWSLK
jgi:hypothetical protein